MLPLLAEGLESAWLPCSLILIVPGIAAVLAARDELVSAVSAFAVATLLLGWLRFSNRGGDWPLGVAAVALIMATVVFFVPVIKREHLSAAAAGLLAGGAAAELWEPCVGSEFGQLLGELPDRGPSGLILMASYVIGVLAPVAGFAAIVKLFPEWLLDPARGVLAVVGGAVLATMAVSTAVGLHDEVVGQLIQWSL